MDLLEKYGLTSEILATAQEYLTDGNILARIYSEHRQEYGIITQSGERTAQVTGKFMFDQEAGLDLPAVGDWVIATLLDDTALIHQLLPRHTLLIRKAAGHKANKQVIAANVDTVCIVQSMDGDFNIRRLERYLVMVHDSGAEAVVLLSKSDLIQQAEIDELTKQADAIAHGTRVFAYSVLDQSLDGILQAVLKPGQTYCFVGSSGVGKSTMINKLLGATVQATAAVREDDSRVVIQPPAEQCFCWIMVPC
jgi:ribosome biogenesis GTPase